MSQLFLWRSYNTPSWLMELRVCSSVVHEPYTDVAISLRSDPWWRRPLIFDFFLEKTPDIARSRPSA